LKNDSDADGGYVMELETETEIETISYIEETDTDETEMETEYEETVAMELPLKYYIVQKGDTLRNISYEIYGDYLHVDDICEWNDIENADNILCGQRLLLH
jgi:nucleoid-associated protein YgaU